MKLKGILSSKARRQIFERNRDVRAPAAPPGALSPEYHRPSEGPAGTLICSCGTSRYTPAAFAAHLAGGAMVDAEQGVYVLRNDPWLREQPERERQLAEQAEARWRAEMVSRYRDEQHAEPRIVDGVSAWMTD